jgi:hypothetical protein
MDDGESPEATVASSIVEAKVDPKEKRRKNFMRAANLASYTDSPSFSGAFELVCGLEAGMAPPSGAAADMDRHPTFAGAFTALTSLIDLIPSIFHSKRFTTLSRALTRRFKRVKVFRGGYNDTNVCKEEIRRP